MTEGADGNWPFDPDGEEGSNEGRRYDMAILSKFEPKDAFPLSVETFLERHGEKPVRMNYQTVLSVADLFEPIEAEHFETKTDFHHAVGDAIRARNRWQYHAQAED